MRKREMIVVVLGMAGVLLGVMSVVLTFGG
jgi:hypothetical protein